MMRPSDSHYKSIRAGDFFERQVAMLLFVLDQLDVSDFAKNNDHDFSDYRRRIVYKNYVQKRKF